MGNYNEDDYDDEGAERTAIVNLAELRRAQTAAPRDRHLLVRVHGNQLGQVIRLDNVEYSIGRSMDSNIWLNDSGMSRHHARLKREGASYSVEDLESANGSFVQGERIQKRQLSDGDMIQLGPSVIFRYSITDEDEENVLRKLYEASVRDSLTGCYNREHFDERLKAEVSYARRHHTLLSLLMYDLDHFKRVNDTYGHQAGDEVLIELSARIRAQLRAEDIFVRYGGEEFSIILRGITVEGAAHVAERLRNAAASQPAVFEGTAIPVTISLGAASLHEAQEPTSQALISVADRRLYAAKHGGRNRVVWQG